MSGAAGGPGSDRPDGESDDRAGGDDDRPDRRGGNRRGEGRGDRRGDGSGGDRADVENDDRRGDGERQVPAVERAMTVVSVGFTLVLVGLVLWQSLTAPTDVRPQVAVTGVETEPAGRVEVAVELLNPGDVGLASVTVELDCATPPPALTFQHVPASGRRQGTVVCPPGTTDPNATVAGWQNA